MDPVWIFVIIIRIFVCILITITFLLLPASLRTMVLIAFLFAAYHWRVYHLPFAAAFTEA